jgi:hypothetical protein
MDWTGTWRNQYGSTLVVQSDAEHRIRGRFQTSLPDSAFFGRSYEAAGIHWGDCINFAFAGPTPKGDAICAFTGVLRDGKLQTVWHVIQNGTAQNKQPWPHAVLTNADTFERA